jgi:hypothetical protein
MGARNTAFTGFDQSMLAFLVPLQPCHVLPAVVQPEKESVQPGARVCRRVQKACCTQNDSTPLENSPAGHGFLDATVGSYSTAFFTGLSLVARPGEASR